MTRVLEPQWVGHLLISGALVTVLTGCATFNTTDLSWGSRMGVRPDAPVIEDLMKSAPCDRFSKYTQYAKDLEEAYRRAGGAQGHHRRSDIRGCHRHQAGRADHED